MESSEVLVLMRANGMAPSFTDGNHLEFLDMAISVH